MKMTYEKKVSLFSEKLKQHLKDAKVKQTHLSQKLQVTPSAVSQMLKCNIVMSLKQLQTICEYINLNERDTIELQTLLSNIRAGSSEAITPFNRFMRDCRRSKGWHLAKLSQESGISPIRLRSFEEDFTVIFTRADAEKLSAVFTDYTVEDFLKRLPVAPENNINFNYDSVHSNAGVLEVAESAAPYHPFKMVKIYELSKFNNFINTIDLFKFTDFESIEETVWEKERDVVGIKANAEDIGIDVAGTVIFFVTDKKTFSGVCRLFLCKDSEKNFRLLQKVEDDDNFYITKPDGKFEIYDNEVVWSLAVVELKFVPKTLI